MRASIRREGRIARRAEEVWAVVGRPELVHLWFPGITSCSFDGTTRTITTATDQTMVEHIITNDPLQRRLQYRFDSPLFKDHLATVDVIDLGDGTSLVLYATDADPATMALVISGGTGGAIDELRNQMESGSGPALDALSDASHNQGGPL
jgi:uncharacterized protein YndB with AHSA1/START domain